MSLNARRPGIDSATWRGASLGTRAGERLGGRAGGLLEDAGECDRLIHRGLDLVQAEVVGDLLRVVDDVVERRREREDVLAVDRRDERVVEAMDDVVGD